MSRPTTRAASDDQRARPRGAPGRCSRSRRCRCAGSAPRGRPPARRRASRPWRCRSSSDRRRPRATSMRSSGIVLVGAAARVAVELARRSARPRSARPSPVTQAVSPRAAATTWPPTTSSRCSSPRTKRSTITSLPSRLGHARRRPRPRPARVQVERDAAAVVAVGRLDHHRQADVLRPLPRPRRRWPRPGPRAPARRSWPAGVLVRSLSLAMPSAMALVQVGLGGPDAALARAVAELHQVAVVQADVRDARGRWRRRRWHAVLGPR